nr:non-specific lipid-transfer protein 2B-like [Ipomoea trifida]GMD44322.1 non-specific lipid-transfer protein 1-like [Ipomoea batatas]
MVKYYKLVSSLKKKNTYTHNPIILPNSQSTAMAVSAKLYLTVLVLLFVAGASVEAQVTCDTVNSDLGPCVPYVIAGIGNGPSSDCCNGLNSLLSAASTQPDRQTACSCLKSLASFISDEQLARAASIPDQCGANIPFTISRDVDCSAVPRLFH